MDQPNLVSKPTTTHEGIPVKTLTLHTILDYAAGVLRQGNPKGIVHGLTTDSRSVKPGQLFVALKGDRFDGHDFVKLCSRQGASGAIVTRNWAAPPLPERFALIEVDDTLKAYQNIAARYRKSLPLKVVAITGSNGKTSTKDLTAAVMSQRFRVTKTQGNLNNHIGVPQTLLSAGASDQVMVLEMGMNHPGEIAPLAAMAQPDIAIITNIGSAHIEYMKTRAAIAQEKGTLAEAVGPSGYVILPAEDDFAVSIAQRTTAQVITVGLRRGDLRADSLVEDISGSRFQIVEGVERQDVRLPVHGLHMVVNSLLAVAAGRVQGLTLRECAKGLETAELTKGRLELKSIAGFQILDDSYNANPDSMVAALKTLAAMPVKGRRIAVLGRMGELGEFSESGHRQVGDAVAGERIDCLITVGSEAEFIAENAYAGGVRDIANAADVAEAARRLHDIAQTDDLILIKGSRSAAMEKIISRIDRSAGSTCHAHRPMMYYVSMLSRYFGPLRVFEYSTFRGLAAALTAFLISFVFGKRVIRKLISLKFGQPVRTREEVNLLYETHGRKKGTPTMGGVLIIVSVVASALLWARPTNHAVWLAIFTIIYLGALGFIDDYIKVTKKNSKGLSGRLKLLAQFVLAVIVVALFLYGPKNAMFGTQLFVPFIKRPLIDNMGLLAFLFYGLVIVGCSNAVNLTDGLDGLAAGCTVTVAGAYAVFAFASSNIRVAEYLQIPFFPGSGELTVLCSALVGAGLGFLWFNAHPAQVFMGDTGSLAIGGFIAVIAICCKQELLLMLVGGVFMMEAVSVIIQVASFKLTGKRVFAMSPIHHHFELNGWKETTVVVRFWILSIIFAVLGLATLKLR